MPDATYNPDFDRLFNIFHALLATRSDLSPDAASVQAIAVHKAFTEALKLAAA